MVVNTQTVSQIPYTSALRCPDCKGVISDVEGGFWCGTCNAMYPLLDGVPILLSSRSPLACRSMEEWHREKTHADNVSKYRHRKLLPPTTPYNLGLPHFKKVVECVSDRELALNLASGRMPSAGPGWINVDLRPSINVNIIADAHFLPFADDTFKAVVCTNSLEYFRRPWQAADEMVRVLAPGGMLYVNTAFVLPYCQDRFRFHGSALVELFDDLEVFGPYATAGPMRTIARLAEQTARALLPWKPASFALAWLVSWCLHPLKFLDLWLLRGNNDDELGTSFCIVGIKRTSA